ncbi:MAG: hypothetical protein R3F34_05960 [Planctomycetota bacterium]
MLDHLSFTLSGDVATYATDVPRARRDAKRSRAAGWVLLAIAAFTAILGGAFWFATLLCGFFGLAAIRAASSLERTATRTVVDRGARTFVRELAKASKDGASIESVERTELPLDDFDEVRLTWYTRRTAGKAKATTQESNLLVRLVGGNGGVTLARFGRFPREDAPVHAAALSEFLGLPLVRDSVRSDTSLFERTDVAVSGENDPPGDDRHFARVLGADEPDDGRDVDVAREQWTLLPENANRARVESQPF